MKEVFTDDSTYSIPYKLWNTIISYIKGGRKRYYKNKVISHQMSLERAVMIVNEYIDYRNNVIITIPFDKQQITTAIQRILMEVK